ncbi:MAG: hypothetical protein ACI4JN_08535 [Ruminococcus sp.]
MNATTFPISLTWHVVFCALACIFFVVQYVRTKKSYQLILAIGIPASLIIYISPENTSLFISVGIFEVILLAGAVVFAFLERNRRKQEKEDTTPLPEVEDDSIQESVKTENGVNDSSEETKTETNEVSEETEE